MNKSIRQVGKNCVGCGNCVAACALSAILMVPDNEGFVYPSINSDKCIGCGKCLSVCPQQMEIEAPQIKPTAYITISNNREIYRKSASGGAFATVATSFMRKHAKSVVCGAAYIEGKVKHVIVENINNIKLLQGSKYVQSDLGSIFREIKNRLDNGNYVLFSGTPCQVKALYTYLGKSYDHLYTIDLVCHGVPSPSFLKKDISLYSNTRTVKEIQFRKKHKFFKSKSNYFLTLKRERSEKVLGVPYNIDPYFNMFMKGMTFRYSCYQCHYANLNRIGDLTVGDCDSASYYPDFHKDEATSLLVVNNKKGMQLLDETENLEKRTIDLQLEASINHQLSEPSVMPKSRCDIYKDINEMSIQDIKIKYAEPYTIKRRIYHFVNAILPKHIVSGIIRRG